MSGEGSHEIATMMCRGLTNIEMRKTHLCWIIDPTRDLVLDHAMVVFYPQGASFTGEESVEFFCHGGRTILKRVLNTCIELGARLAQPGEFSKRAVASGKIDLIQAEAIAILCSDADERAIDLGIQALSGKPSSAVRTLKEGLLDCLAQVEAFLDFSEEDGIVLNIENLKEELESAIKTMSEWLESEKMIRPIIDGFRVVIAGKPNAGKSSLFNAILGRDRAIVHESPGTTRDVISEVLVFGGVQCILVDTAGIREDWGGEIEAEGIRKAYSEVSSADMIIWATEDGNIDLHLINKDKPNIIALTKADLWKDRKFDFNFIDIPLVITSSVDGRGIKEIRDQIVKFAKIAFDEGIKAKNVILGQRQAEAVESALLHTKNALNELLSENGLVEGVSSELRRAIGFLSEVTGEHVTEEVLDRIFSRFCVGK